MRRILPIHLIAFLVNVVVDVRVRRSFAEPMPAVHSKVKVDSVWFLMHECVHSTHGAFA